MSAFAGISAETTAPKPRVLQSTHGKLLLNELQQPSTARISEVLECIKKDPLAGRLTMKTGDNAFHLLVGSTYSHSFIMPVLQELLLSCPEGLNTRNKSGNLPLHLCFTQHRLLEDVTLLVLNGYPQGAAVTNELGLIPLFLSVMREDASAALCRALCKAHPAGPSAMNKTHSYPLHFAAKRLRPNAEILQILLRKSPQAASHMNDFGKLPLHCACELSDDAAVVQLLYEANTDAVELKDRQGRTCLHLAVLNVGKDHSKAVAREEEELFLQAQRIHSKRQNEKHSAAVAAAGLEEYDAAADADDAIEQEFHSLNRARSIPETHEREDAKSRAVVKFLIDKYPAALVEFNNFQATPVDTVLEKTRAQRTKKKVVSVFGLYDDAPTARILLLAQVRYLRKQQRQRQLHQQQQQQQQQQESSASKEFWMPGLRVKDARALRDLNWIARRDALLVTLVGEAQYRSKLADATVTATAAIAAAVVDSKRGGKSVAGAKKTGKTSTANKSSGSGVNTNNITAATAVDSQLLCAMQQLSLAHISSDSDIARNNLLARLRRRGLEELVLAVIQYI